MTILVSLLADCEMRWKTQTSAQTPTTNDDGTQSPTARLMARDSQANEMKRSRKT